MTSSWRCVSYLAPLTVIGVVSAVFIVLTLGSSSFWVVEWTKSDFIERGSYVKGHKPFKNTEGSSHSPRQGPSSLRENVSSGKEHFNHAFTIQPLKGSYAKSATIHALQPLFALDTNPNPATLHIRMSNIVQNVSMAPPDQVAASRQTFNPTIMALPYWSSNHYLSTRSSVEKNWFLFFPSVSASYVHYDLPSFSNSFASERNHSSEIPTEGRSFAKLIGGGLTTPNLTSPDEAPCLPQEDDPLKRSGRWHQASNSLKLVLCRRGEILAGKCSRIEGFRTIHFALIHRKFSNEWALPLRYERYFVAWDTEPPFTMLGMSRYPIQFWNETASGWSSQENWNGRQEQGKPPSSHSKKKKYGWLVTKNAQGQSIPHPNNTIDHSDQKSRNANNKENWAYFTYTPSIAWAWRPRSDRRRQEDTDTEDRGSTESNNDHLIDNGFTGLQVGFLDDEVILGIGIDDKEQAFGRVKAETLLQGLRLCPSSGLHMPKFKTESEAGVERPTAHEVPRGRHLMEQTIVGPGLGRSAMTGGGLHEPEEEDQKSMLDLEHDGF
ncbi:MAG: hypothetical protein Q9160_000433 [Pyrenula sp. 1 TL-2023]